MTESDFNKCKETCEKYGVSFTNDDGTYKSFYEVVHDLAKIWKQLDEKNKDCIIKSLDKV
jgi:TRAP-type C4-dicarboxylate transport system substrate-binding protein